MNFRLILALFCLSLAAGHAEPPAAPDFSEGFRQLAELGLPDLDEKTTWAKLPGNPMDDRELRDVFRSMTGNGWVLETGEALAAGAVKPAGDAPRRPREADLADDVAALVEAIPKQRARADDEYSLRWMRDGGPYYGTLLIFAAQIHQTGRTAEADRLAAAIFNAAPATLPAEARASPPSPRWPTSPSPETTPTSRCSSKRKTRRRTWSGNPSRSSTSTNPAAQNASAPSTISTRCGRASR